MKKFLKKTSKHIMLLLILFDISASCYVLKTNSKYITDGEISYNTNIYTITNDLKISPVVPFVAGKYKVTFTRNKVLYPGESDTYTLRARVKNPDTGQYQLNTCSYETEYTPENGDSGTISKTLSENNNKTSFTFTAVCDVSGVSDSTTIEFYLKETIGSDTVLENTKVVTYYNINLYDKIIHDFEQLDNPLQTYLKSYLMSVFSTNSDFDGVKQLDGLTYSNTYELDEFFIGYAITYYKCSTVTPTGTFNLSFSSENDIDIIFRYYLRKYFHYSESYIGYIEDYIMTNTGASTLSEALNSLSTSFSSIPAIAKSSSPELDQPLEIRYRKELTENVINVKYKLTNYFRVNMPDNGSISTPRTSYTNFVEYFNINEIKTNTAVGLVLRNEFLSLGVNESKLMILNATDSNSTPIKLLLNIYKKSEVVNDVTYVYNYLSVTPLTNGTQIKIANNTTLKFYDLNSDPTGATALTVSDYDEEGTLSVLNTIGSYVYGTEYTNKTLEGFGIAEINNNIVYTLSN